MNYTLINLDVTPPEIEIQAPSYTNRTNKTVITIQANEGLGSYQELYFTDVEGKRYYVTFSHEGDHLTGEMYFNNFPLGLATLHARVKDEVDNLSELASHSFSILESEYLTSDMSLSLMNNSFGIFRMDNKMMVDMMENKMEVKV